MNGILNEVLTKDISSVEVFNDGVPSLYDDFPNKRKVTECSELRFLQIALARRAIIEKGGYLGEMINQGEYIKEERLGSHWEIYELNDGTGRIGVLWNHFDDDSWSIIFKADNLELAYLYYEN